MEKQKMELLQQIAKGIATQFGPQCEVVVHDLSVSTPEHSIVFIENGHVTGRKLGDGASKVVLEQLTSHNDNPQDHLGYLTRTPDGKILKSSTMYIRNSKGKVCAILSINHDISSLIMVENALKGLLSTENQPSQEPERIVNVNDLLDDLLLQSVALVGKPVAMMNKDDKVKAIQFLNRNGAFQVMKSGNKVAQYFGISKYTLYSYIDMKPQEES